ncbi:MAG TPA: hypothetical protein VM638_00075, partial [Actinomycetota bacterium]|nr:hypothetical protein [Actinomycetota bacterium]
MSLSDAPANRPERVDVLVRGCDAVTMDDAGTVVSDAAIAVAGGRIVWIGRSRDAGALPKAET